ncbi:hypothetical protein CJ030_MR1G002309 [Morella rubra]|uniref:Uncharacterized protein n=1 Tax=Morella rubra TaxID=262757 RepID=A0A6A1WK89_9ROSI|nr:hypothetical protein CJ030_MR1G002309 [Morella rubra]
MKNSGGFLMLLLVLFLRLLTHSEGEAKFCPAEITAEGQCSSMFGASDCFHHMRAKYGEAPFPPTNCKCSEIPQDSEHYTCQCDVPCEEDNTAASPAPPPVSGPLQP